MPNIEIKARCQDLAQARAHAVRLGGRHLWTDRQVDTYFFTRGGKLKLRQSELNGSELIPYLKKDVNGLKRSDYAKLPVKEADLVKGLLADLLGQKSEVCKTREVYLIGNVRVHLDEVEDLGSFLEFEAVFSEEADQPREQIKVNDLMKEFGVRQDDLCEGSYPDLIAASRGPLAMPPTYC
jgi:adenylate cyclase class 2